MLNPKNEVNNAILRARAILCCFLSHRCPRQGTLQGNEVDLAKRHQQCFTGCNLPQAMVINPIYAWENLWAEISSSDEEIPLHPACAEAFKGQRNAAELSYDRNDDRKTPMRAMQLLTCSNLGWVNGEEDRNDVFAQSGHYARG